MTAQERAEKLARELFTDGAGRKYRHMSLDEEKKLGWGEPVLAYKIQKAIESAVAEAVLDEARWWMAHHLLAGTVVPLPGDSCVRRIADLKRRLQGDTSRVQGELDKARAACIQLSASRLAIALFGSWLDVNLHRHLETSDFIGAWDEARNPGCYGWKYFSKKCVEEAKKNIPSNPGAGILDRVCQAEFRLHAAETERDELRERVGALEKVAKEAESYLGIGFGYSDEGRKLEEALASVPKPPKSS